MGLALELAYVLLQFILHIAVVTQFRRLRFMELTDMPSLTGRLVVVRVEFE